MGRHLADRLPEPDRRPVHRHGARRQGHRAAQVHDRRDQPGHPPPGGAGHGRRHRAGGVGRPGRRSASGGATPRCSTSAARRCRSPSSSRASSSSTPTSTARRSTIERPTRAGCAGSTGPRQPPVPIDIAASGPKVIAFAARTVERVTFAVGADPERMAWALDLARTAMRRRRPRPTTRCRSAPTSASAAIPTRASAPSSSAAASPPSPTSRPCPARPAPAWREPTARSWPRSGRRYDSNRHLVERRRPLPGARRRLRRSLRRDRRPRRRARPGSASWPTSGSTGSSSPAPPSTPIRTEARAGRRS